MRPLMKPEEVAQAIGVTTRTLRRRVIDGRFPAPIKLGRLTRWRHVDVEIWMLNNGIAVPDPETRKDFESGRIY